jgi:hypothetical protein
MMRIPVAHSQESSAKTRPATQQFLFQLAKGECLVAIPS